MSCKKNLNMVELLWMKVFHLFSTFLVDEGTFIVSNNVIFTFICMLQITQMKVDLM